jgi:predicted nucleotidyltransferase
MPRLGTLLDRKAKILALAARHGARNVRVFGSVARGDARPDSDVDLLVEFEPGTGLLRHAALIRELEQLLGCKVDVVSQNGVKARIRARVLQEAVPL